MRKNYVRVPQRGVPPLCLCDSCARFLLVGGLFFGLLSSRPCRRLPWQAISGGRWAPWSTRTSSLSPVAGPSTRTGLSCRAKANTLTLCSASGACSVCMFCAFHQRRPRCPVGQRKKKYSSLSGTVSKQQIRFYKSIAAVCAACWCVFWTHCFASRMVFFWAVGSLLL